MAELWRDISGYEGLYKISNAGQVFSIRRNKILTPVLSHHGYKRVLLYDKNGIQKAKAIHRLVATEWIKNPEVNHKNLDTGDNRVENLEWCDRKYNVNYGGRTEKLKHKISMYDRSGRHIKNFQSQLEAAREVGISQGSISNAIIGRTKTAGGYIWRNA